MTPAEAAQERAQRRGRRHALAQHRSGPACPQGIRVIDAVATGERRSDEREQFVADMRPSRCGTEVNMRIPKLAQPEMRRQRHRQQQSRVRYQPLVVEDHAQAVHHVR